MNARARVEDDAPLPEPITTPPPAGAADMYSAPTRVSTLPEDVLASMRVPRAARLPAEWLVSPRSSLPPPPSSLPAFALPPPPPPLPPSVARSLVTVALFAALGGLAAAAITFSW